MWQYFGRLGFFFPRSKPCAARSQNLIPFSPEASHSIQDSNALTPASPCPTAARLPASLSCPCLLATRAVACRIHALLCPPPTATPPPLWPALSRTAPRRPTPHCPLFFPFSSSTAPAEPWRDGRGDHGHAGRDGSAAPSVLTLSRLLVERLSDLPDVVPPSSPTSYLYISHSNVLLV